MPVMEDMSQPSQESEELQIDPDREAYYKDDPKKALKKFFDKEGIGVHCRIVETSIYSSNTVYVHVHVN
jgi:hypothetical protein